jgi:hypothetical protein
VPRSKSDLQFGFSILDLAKAEVGKSDMAKVTVPLHKNAFLLTRLDLRSNRHAELSALRLPALELDLRNLS